ncbi:ubiquitin carboxyl-terminal hydrolase 10-like isoform X1 [Arapaima gigas]
MTEGEVAGSMASPGAQYIFGEFSPDEFNQFFVTPRCYVELPPFNDKVSCVSQSAGSYCAPAEPFNMEAMRLQVCGDDYHRIKFGVDEVMDADAVGVKVSSTLNPQAPEFILGCQPPQKLLPAADVPDGGRFDALGSSGADGPSLEDGQVCQDLDGPPGALGQRERKKKKKRPPGYYSYLEGSEGAGAAPQGAGLVNGHTTNSMGSGSDDMVGGLLSPPDISGNGPVDSPAVGATSDTSDGQRTCESPQEAPLELPSSTASLSYCNTAASSSSSSTSSHSGRMPDAARTAQQRLELPTLESPELPDSGRHSPSPTSPPPPCCSSADNPPPEAEDAVAVVNGLAEGDSPSSADEQKDSCDPEELPPLAEPSSATNGDAQSHASPDTPPALPPPPVAQPPKSWASLFHNSKPLPGGPQAYVEVKNTPPAVSTPPPAQTSGGICEVKGGPVHVSEDPLAPKLAELIEEVKLIHKPVSLQPRGLINKGNWCYINATLQALIACPPMYHLMKSISILNETQRPCTSTPMIDNFVRLVNEFSNMPVPPKPKLQAAGDKIMKDIRPGTPFEPDYIYRLLTVIKSSLSEKGRQEDAEEYLGFILNGLHEEMLALKKLLSPQEEKAPSLNGPGSQATAVEDVSGREEEGDDEGSEDEWEQVGPRNRSSVTRQADFVRTPITDIFGGHIRSVVYQQSSRESATLQPFFTLQLDIQSEKIRTVQEALESLVARESVQGYTTKSKQEIEVSRRVTLEELPPVLVLHLKRFVFEKTGGCQKLVKNIEYPVDLEISKDLLSPGVRSKIFKGQRTYRLFAVVYHHGNSVTGGHYTTDVFHIGLNGWLRIDDQAVKVINQYQVLKYSVERTAYLLYYRRVDLM